MDDPHAGRVETATSTSPAKAPISNSSWSEKQHGQVTTPLYSGRSIRTLNVLDQASRSALGIDIATSIPALRVIRFLEQLIEIHRKPAAIRCDNGPELTSYAFAERCKAKEIELRFIQPGKPDQDAFVERFSRTYRDEVIDAYTFDSIQDVRDIIEDWLCRYKESDRTTPGKLATSALPRATAR